MTVGSRTEWQGVNEVECTLCENLKAELGRLERIHAEKLRFLVEGTDLIRRNTHRALRIAVNDAMLDSEIARAKLNRHLREHQDHLTAPA